MEETHEHDVSSLIALAKTVAAYLSTKDGEKYFVKFLTPTRT